MSTGFSYKMSLKGVAGMLGIDYQHGRFGSNKPGADWGVSGGERRGSICWSKARRGIRVDGADLGAAAIPGAKPGGKGHVTALYRPHDRPESGAGDTADRELCRQWPGEGYRVPTQEICDTLHEIGRGAAGLCRQESREPEWPGNQADFGARVQRIRPGCLPARGGHFGGADLSVPELSGLSQAQQQLSTDTADSDSHRRAAQTATAGPSRIPAHRHGASGRSRRQQRDLSHQRGRRSDAMGDRGSHTADLRTLVDSL